MTATRAQARVAVLVRSCRDRSWSSGEFPGDLRILVEPDTVP
ncbi:hypothetical protein [Saccharopolyspora gloriosae]|nr:hypothetical protein [Saccharopolyspora gloriosae]